MSYPKSLKRALDLVCSTALIVLTSPVLCLVAIGLLLAQGTPLLHSQQRAGLNGLPFTLRKFRTMTNDKDASGNLRPDDQRLTRWGRLLRLTSLDELPQLWNVLLGDMSLVGPRPLPLDYLRLYSREQMRRHDVRPGITGLAQVKGRNLLSWEDKFGWDVHYVDHLSFWLDLRILVSTALVVLKSKGVSADGSATMPRFEGAKSTNEEGTPGV